MKGIRATAWMGVLLGTAGATGASGQVVELTRPDAEAPEAFSMVQTVRELPDGRVLVADPLGQALVVLDLRAAVADTLGRVGQGPREYRQPDAVWPLPGGASLLVDLGNGRLTELGPDLAFGPTAPIAKGDPRAGDLVLAIPQGVDDRGRLYFRSMIRPAPGGSLPDSGAVLRLDRGTGVVDTVATFKLEGRTSRTSGGPNDQRQEISPIPLSPADAWGVAPDGRVAMIRSGDYHLEWIGAGGQVVRGPAVPYDRIRIGQAEKEEWLEEQETAGGGLQIGITMENGVMSMRFGRGGPSDEPDLDRYQWPEVKPPFYNGRVLVDGAGRAWVRRHVDAGERPTYDVFDAGGRRTQQVRLARGRRLVGFGKGAAYAVHADEFGLQYLERYPLP